MKQNKSPMKNIISSSHCVLKGKDDLAISLNNQIPSLQSVHDSVKVTETSLGKEICSSHDMNVGNNYLGIINKMCGLLAVLFL